jgi:hypothetical protein
MAKLLCCNYVSIFTKHPHERGMTYFGHLTHALKLGYMLAKGCIGICIHALCPFWFQTIATDTNKELEQCLKNSPLKMDLKS